MHLCTWCLDPLVVVGVDAHLVLLKVEGELARVDGAQLMVAVQVGPSPQAAVDDVRQPFAVRHLQASIQRSNPGTETQERRGQRGGEKEQRKTGNVPNGQRKENMDGEREESWFRPQFGLPSSTTADQNPHFIYIN